MFNFLSKFFKKSLKPREKKFAICVDNKGQEDYLTVDFTYLILDHKNGIITVTADDEMPMQFWEERFELLK